MKEFNKTQELLKLKIKQNKNTYIKRISIILSCVILLVGIIMFTFAKFESNKSYTLIQGKLGDYSSGDITLSYVVDGMSQSVPPQKGSGYKLKNVECTNTEFKWDKKTWEVSVVNYTGKVKCNLEFESVSEITATLYGGVNEVVTLDDEIEYTMDSTGKKEGITFAIGEHTLKGSISNQTFIVNVDPEDTTVAAMPNNGDGVIYWYGNKLNNTFTSYSFAGYSYQSPSYNTNNIILSGLTAASRGTGIKTSNKINKYDFSKLLIKTNSTSVGGKNPFEYVFADETNFDYFYAEGYTNSNNNPGYTFGLTSSVGTASAWSEMHYSSDSSFSGRSITIYSIYLE